MYQNENRNLQYDFWKGNMAKEIKNKSNLISRLSVYIYSQLEAHGCPWYKMPSLSLSILCLAVIKKRLRICNLFPAPKNKSQPNPPSSSIELTGRSSTGAYTNLQKPAMGAAGTCFGRNMPPSASPPDSLLMTPNPRDVSDKLLARTEFLPALSLNLLAAAWIQFQIHGWFRHGQDHSKFIEIPKSQLCKDENQIPLKIPKTLESTEHSTTPPSFVNMSSHWWDGSQIYGSNENDSNKFRSYKNGKLNIEANGLLPLDPIDNIEITGMRDNWWVGLSLIHTIFVKEHNAICDHLASLYPSWNDDDLYRISRLINIALMAKIHTLEWTTAILNNPTLVVALKTTWSGLKKQGRHILALLTEDDLKYGALGAHTEFRGVDYCLTEEFASVYRLHPLIPDDVAFYSVRDNSHILTAPMLDLARDNARLKIQSKIDMTDIFYSFGISHPGAITLKNYPSFLRRLNPQPFEQGMPAPPMIDLASIEILRDRERGVPRYNAFREGLGMPRMKNFAELTGGDLALAKEIEDLYGNIDLVDLMVGLYAEPKPPGFGFSDTAFRIFIIMAGRRVECDRFLTEDYNEKTYTKAGLDWVENNSMISVLLRHYPKLLPALKNVENAFAPWTKTDLN